jgi:hypothetical protein
MGPKVMTGFVGFLDILGYREFLRNNDIQLVVTIIKSLLVPMPKMVGQQLLGHFEDIEVSGTTDRKIKKVAIKTFKDSHNKIKTLIISDTIILTMPADPIEVFGFVFTISYLLRHSFDAGLPLRGAIDYGEFFIEDNVFAGKPFVESYELSNRLALSGCVLTEGLKDRIGKSASEPPNNSLLFPYKVPLNDGKEADCLVVDWLSPFVQWGEVPLDVKQYIETKFSAFGKQIKSNVRPKIDNTEKILRDRETTKGVK